MGRYRHVITVRIDFFICIIFILALVWIYELAEDIGQPKTLFTERTTLNNMSFLHFLSSLIRNHIIFVYCYLR